MTARAFRSAAALAAIVALGVTGCSHGSAEPDAQPSSRPSASTTTDPQEGGVALSAAALGQGWKESGAVSAESLKSVVPCGVAPFAAATDVTGRVFTEPSGQQVLVAELTAPSGTMSKLNTSLAACGALQVGRGATATVYQARPWDLGDGTVATSTQMSVAGQPKGVYGYAAQTLEGDRISLVMVSAGTAAAAPDAAVFVHAVAVAAAQARAGNPVAAVPALGTLPLDALDADAVPSQDVPPDGQAVEDNNDPQAP